MYGHKDKRTQVHKDKRTQVHKDISTQGHNETRTKGHPSINSVITLTSLKSQIIIPQLEVIQTVASGGLGSRGTPALGCKVWLEVLFASPAVQNWGRQLGVKKYSSPGAVTESAATQ